MPFLGSSDAHEACAIGRLVLGTAGASGDFENELVVSAVDSPVRTELLTLDRDELPVAWPEGCGADAQPLYND